MASGVFLIQKDGQLVEMSEESYGSEADFQELLAKYPNLLAGNQINDDAAQTMASNLKRGRTAF